MCIRDRIGYLITIVGVAVFLVMLAEAAIRRRKGEANPLSLIHI